MDSLWRAATNADPDPSTYADTPFWSNPDRSGWLTKQSDWLKSWRRRYFILKDNKLLWFKDNSTPISPSSVPRGVIPLNNCLTVKGAEDVVGKPHAFEVSTGDKTVYFVAGSEKEKEDWISSIGRAIVRGSRSVTDSEVVDYT